MEVPGETRQNLTLLDESTGIYTKINEPGPTIGPEHLAALHALVAAMAAPGDLWALCGSLPPGAPADFYADLVTAVQARGARAILDTSETALYLGLAARPAGIKPNSEEAAQALGQPVASDEEHVAAVRRLRRSAESGGAARADSLPDARRARVAAGRGRRLVVAEPPLVAARSPVGAGDATLAGLLWALADGCDATEMARRAVACGTAAAMQEGTGVGTRALVDALRPQVRSHGCRSS